MVVKPYYNNGFNTVKWCQGISGKEGEIMQKHNRSSRAWMRYLIDHMQPPDTLTLVVSAILVGILTALSGVLFIWLLERIAMFTAVVRQMIGSAVGLAFMMGLAGVVVGFVVWKWAPEVAGGGIPEVMKDVALRNGRIRPRVAPFKIIASAITIGTGGSAGREGPIVLTGASFGSAVGQLLHFPAERLRTMVACGSAAGIAALFNAPIAGSIFALEVILGKFTVRYFGMVVVSAVAASIVGQAFLGDAPAFAVPAYSFQPVETPFYIFLGVAAALTAVFFVKTMHWLGALFSRWQMPVWVKTAVGMIITACIGLLIPGELILGSGLEFIGQAITTDFNLPLSFLIILFFAKILATGLTLESGNSGGFFSPSLFVGATLGGIVGTIAHTFWPAVAVDPGAYAIVGMAAVLSGAARAPISSVLIIFEMSGDYQLILPLMLATVLSTFIAETIFNESIYSFQLKRRGITLHRGRDLDVMQSLSVSEAMAVNPRVVSPSLSVKELGALFRQTHQHSFPVVDPSLKLIGMVSLLDYERAIEQNDETTMHVQDIATIGRLLIAYADEPLSEAVQRLAVRGVSRMPVVTREHPDRVVGVIGRREIANAYNIALARRVEDEANMETVTLPLSDRKMKFIELEILPESRAVDLSLAELANEFPYDCVVVSIKRYGALMVPHGDSILQPGDLVNIFVRRTDEAQVRHCLGRRKAADA